MTEHQTHMGRMTIEAAVAHEHDYRELLAAVGASFGSAVAGGGPLFRTDAEGLFGIYLDGLPAERQVHNCATCRRFLDRFGGIAIIDDEGDLVSPLWSVVDVPEFYRAAFTALAAKVKRARIVSVFRCREQTWGTPVTGPWSHLSVTPPPGLVYRERALTAGQAMATAKESYRTVAAALSDFEPAMLDEALRLLTAESLHRSERFVGPVKWLRDLHARPKGRRGENLLWRAIATAPEGFCHPRASVVGSLLEDIAAGLSFEAVKSRWDAKLGPMAYQRPQAAPSAGSIKAAEELFAKLGLEPALHRRLARIEEVPLIWSPKPTKETRGTGGIFGHLSPKGEMSVQPLDIPAQTMTWDKFSRTVLPNAERLRFLVPNRGAFVGITTAEHADAPPILKWDRDDERNPLAWYLHFPTGAAPHWNLHAGALVDVTGIAAHPTMHGSRPMPEIAEGAILLLAGARDVQPSVGNAIFPETLKAELHVVRSVMEAYARTARMGGRAEATACGYDIRKGSNPDVMLRGLVGGAWNAYRIDRWD